MNLSAFKFALSMRHVRFWALLVISAWTFLSLAKDAGISNGGPTQLAEKNSLFFDYSAHYRLGDFLSLNSTSIPEFLRALPTGLRSNYTLVYNSGSIQEASFKDPRAIIFSPTADLVLSFNGHEDMVGGEAIEAIEYNEIAERYDFHEITFSASGPRDLVNPRKCQGCHTEAYIPNWRAYNQWVGSYGSNLDGFEGYAFPYFKDGRPAIGFLKEPTQLAHFLEFNQSRSSNGDRYVYLYNPWSEDERWPFFGAPANRVLTPEAIDYEPNRRLTVGLIYHLARMLGTRLERSQLFQNYPANIVSQLLECDLSEKTFIEKLEQVRSQSILRFGAIDHPWGEMAPHLKERSEKYPSQLYPFLNSLSVTGVLPDYWMLNHFSRNPLFSERILSIGNNAALTSFSGFYDMNETPLLAGLYLYGELQKLDASVRVPETGPTELLTAKVGLTMDFMAALGKVIPLYARGDVAHQVCPKLKPLVQKELQQNAPIAIEIDHMQKKKYEGYREGIPYAIGRCISCHTQRNYLGAPYIPFDRPILLRQALHENNDALLKDIERRTKFDAPDNIRMPKGPFSILPGQSRQLVNYLKNL